MTATFDRVRRQKRVSPFARIGDDMLDTIPTPPPDVVSAVQADREQHLASRPCVVDDCMFGVPCPTHGVPAEDRGQWMEARRG